MKNILTFLIISLSQYLYCQEYIEPFTYNNLLINHKKSDLKLRTDSINYDLDIIPLNLPFLDDFSTDKRLTKAKINATSGTLSLAQGKCSTFLKQYSSTYKFNKDSAFEYNFIFGTPNRVDSNYLPAIFLYVFDDTTDCKNPTNTLTFYPSYYRYTFNMTTGKKIDSVLISDTSFYCAIVKSVLFKKGILWLDEYAYVNNQYGFMPPSIGVATLDGLNEKGRAYDVINTNSYGLADYLTSNKINLSGRLKSDSTFLSFMAQPQGFGDWPDIKDSLVVQFKDIDNHWNSVFKIDGLTSRKALDSNLRFNHYLIYVPGQDIPSDPNYYHSNFQFRFLNYATLSGNNDHWNIDYVKLDTARNSYDTTFKEATFVYNLPTLLKNYTLLPAKQFSGQSDLVDTSIAYNKNFLPTPILSTYKIKCTNETTANTIFQSPSGIPYAANPLSLIQYYPSLNFVLNNPMPDSTFISSKVFVDASDIIETNDTARHSQFFFNEMAYDDGSAEMAYGIQGNGLKKVAYKFIIPKKDTLVAIKMLFTTIDMNVSNVVFNLTIWKSIGMNGSSEVILKTITNKKPIYIDTINSFYTFGLDTPLTVQDSIYIGWTQSDENNIAVGYDRNSTLGFDKMFIYTNNIWGKSNVIHTGSPMMRLILDGKRDYRPKNNGGSNSIVETTPKLNTTIFPNPCAEYLKINTENLKELSFVLQDITGRTIHSAAINHGIAELNTSSIVSGLYILGIYQHGIQIDSKKIIISH